MSGLQSKLSFNDWGALQQLFTKPLSDAEDLLWHLGWFVKNEASSRPRWAGFMHDEEHSIPPSATVTFYLLNALLSTVHLSAFSQSSNAHAMCHI